jgi:deoxycytidylate deaminase
MVKAARGAVATKVAAASNINNLAEIKDTHTSELVIALCGPIGSPIHDVAKAFKECLEKSFGYDYAHILKLSWQIEKLGGSAPPGSEYQRVKYLIDKGDELRERYGAGVLTELAVSEIALDRQKNKKKDGPETFEPRRVCHIIDSIKNQQELDLLRLVYRDMVYVVGVYAPQARRTKSLEQKGMSLQQIYTLIDRDSGEEFAHGQTVRDTFPNADFFLRIDSNSGSQVEARVERFLNLILGVKVMTPTYSETAMYAAASAAGNSACLSRQVGAAITDAKGDVIATGWNDVPKFGGGLYAADPNGDQNIALDVPNHV